MRLNNTHAFAHCHRAIRSRTPMPPHIKDHTKEMVIYETRQSFLMYDFVYFFGFDRARNTIVVYSVLRNQRIVSVGS